MLEGQPAGRSEAADHNEPHDDAKTEKKTDTPDSSKSNAGIANKAKLAPAPTPTQPMGQLGLFDFELNEFPRRYQDREFVAAIEPAFKLHAVRPAGTRKTRSMLPRRLPSITTCGRGG